MGSKNKKAVTSKSWVLLVWAGCPQEEPSPKCGIRKGLPRRKMPVSQADCSESSTLRQSQQRCSFLWPWPVLGRVKVGWTLHPCLLINGIAGESQTNSWCLADKWPNWRIFLLLYLSQDPENTHFFIRIHPTNICIWTLRTRIAFVVAKITKKWSWQWKAPFTFERHSTWGRNQTKWLLLRMIGERENARSSALVQMGFSFPWKMNT